jgi:hypothetical protein
VDQSSIVERAKQGDEDAFAALIDQHVARLDATARLVLRDPELARDAVQECLIRAWRDLPRLREPDRLAAWLYRLTLNAGEHGKPVILELGGKDPAIVCHGRTSPDLSGGSVANEAGLRGRRPTDTRLRRRGLRDGADALRI